MANDYITLNALASELNDILEQGKVNKINVLDDSSFIIVIRAKGQNHNLLFSAASGLPSVYLTKHKFEGMETPTTFCMLLRKHLTNGTIEKVSLLNCDRLICLSITAKNELYDTTNFNLVLEYMGARSNIILLDHNNKIIDAVKRIFEGNHTVIPNQTYVPPTKTKPDLYDLAAIEQISSLDPNEYLEGLTKNIVGLCKETAKEICHLITKNNLTLSQAIAIFKNIYHEEHYRPCVTDKGVFVYPYLSLVSNDITEYDSLNSAFDEFYAKINAEQKKSIQTKDIRTKLKRLRSRLDKRIAENTEKLKKSDQIEHFLQQAEILKCNLHNIRNGYSILNCFDFYNTCQVDLKIDPSLSPKKNLENYYKKYTKLKGMISYAEKEKIELHSQNQQLLSIEEGLNNATCKADYNDLAHEIDMLLPKKQKDSKKPKKQPKIQLLCINIDSFKVYVGKTNLQNQEITFKIASPNDIWLHVKDYHGSHTLIICDNSEVPLKIVEKAASYAAYYSGARNQTKVQVDYTKRKYVKKLPNSPLVTYSNQKTIIVCPQID